MLSFVSLFCLLGAATLRGPAVRPYGASSCINEHLGHPSDTPNLPAPSLYAWPPSRRYVNNVTVPNGVSSSSSAAQPSLAALAAAAAWDVEVGGAGGAATVPYDIVTLVDWLAAKLPNAPGPDRQDALAFLQPLVRSLVESSRTELPRLDPPRIPAMIKSVALLGHSPSREWVAEAFQCAAASASQLSGAELVAMLRVSHAQQIPLPLPTLDAVCRWVEERAGGVP